MKKLLILIFISINLKLIGQIDTTNTLEQPTDDTKIFLSSSASVGSAYIDIKKKYSIPSPHAAEIGRYGAISVGLYTGTMKYDIPIIELKNENLNIPVFLSYSSNGLQVDKFASWVGYDWNLNAGGIINRYRKGKKDTPGTRPTYPDWSNMSSSEKCNYLEGYIVSERDLEPDIFVFNFLNYSGKFFFDENGIVKFIPHLPYIVKTNATGEYQFFEITTPDGVTYKFYDTDTTQPSDELSYNTSWHLSRIVHPSGDSISFSYNKISLQQRIAIDRSVTQKIANDWDPLATCNYSDFVKQIKIVNNSVSYLNTITFHGLGKIIFSTTSTRSDSQFEYKIDKISLTDLNNNPKTSVKLFYQFRLCNKQVNSLCNSYDQYRMFLDSVQFLGSNELRVKSYGFEYNDIGNLPPRFSFSQDHKGYYNGKSNNDIISINDIPSIYQGIFAGFIGSTVNRTSNYLYSQKGMINKIIYPSGGYTIIDYEPNKNSSGIEIAGCRVLRLKNYSSSGSIPEIKKILYLQPITSPTLNPVYYYEYKTYYEYYYDWSRYEGACTFGVISSNSLDNVYVEGNNHICYSLIEILSGENGENGIEKHSYHVNFDSPSTPLNNPPGQIFPVPVSNTGWTSGNLTNTLFRSNISDKKNTQLNYNFTETRNKKEMKCLVVQKRLTPYNLPADPYYQLQYYAVVPYTLYSNWFYISSKVVTDYESNGNIIQTTNYSYNNANHAQLSQESFFNSLGQSIQKKFYYPHDYGNIENFSTLKNKNIISKPIDIRTYNGAQLIEGQQYKYNGLGQITDIYNAEVISGSTINFSSSNAYTFTPRVNYKYLNKNSLNQENPVGDISTFYLWDSSGKYLMAKIVGGTCSWSSISSYDRQNCQYSSKALMNSLKSVTSGSIITTYSYSHLVGIKEITDPTGITTYFRYDNFGRMFDSKNEDGQMLQNYLYKYSR